MDDANCRGSKVEDESTHVVSTILRYGQCIKEIKKGLQAGYNGWRQESRVIYDRREAANLKLNVSKTAVRPTLLEADAGGWRGDDA